MIYVNIAALTSIGIMFVLFGGNTESRALGIIFIVLAAWNVASLLIGAA